MESSGHRCLAATTAHARRLADDRLVSHVTRRLPSAWPRTSRLGGAVHGTGGRPARAAEDRARRDSRDVAVRCSGGPGAVRAARARSRYGGAPRPHAVAVARLVRLLP